jgi:hypothetical protein
MQPPPQAAEQNETYGAARDTDSTSPAGNDAFFNAPPAETPASGGEDIFGSAPAEETSVAKSAVANGLAPEHATDAAPVQPQKNGPLEQWRQERDEKLRKLKEQEKEEKERVHEDARKEREQMWEQRNKEVDSRHKANLANEETKVYDGTGASNAWEGVLDLTDFESENANEQSRQRQLLFKLKRSA